MKHTENIAELGAALAKAQTQMKGAVKGAQNPFFKSKYADLASVSAACMDALNEAGIAVVQSPSTSQLGVSVETMLVHSSGQWISETLTSKAKDDGPQALGSVITYLRRYALAAFAGVAPEDDDGNAAEGHNRKKTEPRAVVIKDAAKPGGYDDWVLDQESIAQNGSQALYEAFKASKVQFRNYRLNHDSGRHLALKAKALNVQVPA